MSMQADCICHTHLCSLPANSFTAGPECRLTQRWEASLWLNGRQLYLGGFNSQAGHRAARHCTARLPPGLLPARPPYGTANRPHTAPSPPSPPTHFLRFVQEDAAHAYDLAALACKGLDAIINFSAADYTGQLREIQGFTRVRWLWCPVLR